MSRKKLTKRKAGKIQKRLTKYETANKKVKYWKHRQKMTRKYNIKNRK